MCKNDGFNYPGITFTVGSQQLDFTLNTALSNHKTEEMQDFSERFSNDVIMKDHYNGLMVSFYISFYIFVHIQAQHPNNYTSVFSAFSDSPTYPTPTPLH